MKNSLKILLVLSFFVLPLWANAAEWLPISTPLRYGNTDKTTGGSVSKLQKMLNIPKPTGYFGASTRVKVRNFQREFKLPITGVVDVRTAEVLKAVMTSVPLQQTPIAPPIEKVASIGVSNNGVWERETYQYVVMSEKIRQQKNQKVSIRLISQNDFAHGDVYYIVMDVVNDMGAHNWLVGTSTAHSTGAAPILVPAGKYEVEVCAGNVCDRYLGNITIPYPKAANDPNAVMASLRAGSLYYNYIQVGNKLLTENGNEIPFDKLVSYPGHTVSVYYRTKNITASSTIPVSIRLYSQYPIGIEYRLAINESRGYPFKFVVGQDFEIASATYYVEVCIQGRCNVAEDLLEIKPVVLNRAELASSTYQYPNFLMIDRGTKNEAGLSTHTFRRNGVGYSPSKYDVTVTEVKGSVLNYPYVKLPYLRISNGGLNIYGLTREQHTDTVTKLVHVKTDQYLIVEGQPMLVDYIVNSASKK